VREALGDIVAACELREGSRVGIPGRPHHYRSVLRDQIGNVWTCKHEHADQDDAHACAKAEYERRVESGEIKTRGRRKPVDRTSNGAQPPAATTTEPPPEAAVEPTSEPEMRRARDAAALGDGLLGVFCTNAASQIIDANPAILRILGCDWAYLKGKTFEEITHPEDTWIAHNAFEKLRSGAKEHSTYEKRFLAADGTPVLCAVRISGIGMRGELAGVVVMVADLTERPENPAAGQLPELLRKVLATAPMLLFAYDMDGIITLCEGRGCEELLGEGDLVGRPIWELFAGQEGVDQQFRRGLAGESGDVNFTLGKVQFKCQYQPIWDAEHTRLGVSGVALDVTELLQVGEENAQLSNFLAAMSHELRTPLTTILGFAQLLADESLGTLTDRQKRYVQHIDGGGHQLLSLVNDILDLSKVKAGQMTLADDPLDAREVLHTAAVQVGALAESKGIEMVERPGPAIRFIADGRRVHQILLNLLSNALKFTPTGGTIEVSGRAGGATDVILSVTDTGSGIPPDQLEGMFDEYRQADGRQGPNREGTGLGLALSRRFAIRMGGRLEAESEEGVGSTFRLTLPDGSAPLERVSS
jgi:PAS domain S-box-containing protein